MGVLPMKLFQISYEHGKYFCKNFWYHEFFKCTGILGYSFEKNKFNWSIDQCRKHSEIKYINQSVSTAFHMS